MTDRIARYFGYVSKNKVLIEALKWATELNNRSTDYMNELSDSDDMDKYVKGSNDFFNTIEKTQLLIKFAHRISEKTY